VTKARWRRMLGGMLVMSMESSFMVPLWIGRRRRRVSRREDLPLLVGGCFSEKIGVCGNRMAYLPVRPQMMIFWPGLMWREMLRRAMAL
jgi:hypothetical protein